MNDQLQLLDSPATEFYNDHYSELLILRSSIKKFTDEEDVVSKAFFELEKILPQLDAKLAERFNKIRIQLKQPEDLLCYESYWANKKQKPKEFSIVLPEIRSYIATIDLLPSTPLFTKLNKLINDCFSLIDDLKKNTDPAVKTACQLITNARNYYISYRDDRIIPSKNEQRLAWCDGRTRMRSFLGYHYINAGSALRFTPYFREDQENKTGVVMAKRDNQFGIHSVFKINRIFSKIRPDSPLNQALYDRFLEGDDSAATELILLENRIGSFPVLASKSVEGMSLYDLLENHLDWIHLIDASNLSALIIKSLLLCLSDGKADNFIALIEFNEQRKPIKITIVAIDSDHLLKKPIVAMKDKDKLKHIVDLKFIFGFFPQMKNQIDHEFREYFLHASPESIMLKLLSALTRQEQHYMGYSSSTTERTNQNNLTVKELDEVDVPIHFLPGRIQSLYEMVREMQTIMRANKNMTHDELFQHFYPIEHFFYKHVTEKINGPLKALTAIYRYQVPFIEDVPNIPAAMLQKLSDYPDNTQDIKRKIKEGETLLQACQRFFDSIDYQKLSTTEQEEILVDMTIKFSFLQQLVFRNCVAFTDENLAILSDRFPHITAITLINCTNITGVGLIAFMQKNTQAHVTLENMAGLSDSILLSLIEYRDRLTFIYDQNLQQNKGKNYLPLSLIPVLSTAPANKPSQSPAYTTATKTHMDITVAQRYLNDIDYALITNIHAQRKILHSIVTNFYFINELIIRNCDALNDERLIMISHLPKLTSITIDNCKNLKGRGVSALLCQHPNINITIINTLQLAYNTWLSLLENAQVLTIVIGQKRYQTNDQTQLVNLLAAAAEQETDNLLTALLLFGAHLIKDPTSEFSALHFACEKGNLRVVNDLLGCKVAVNCKDNKTGLTALDVCFKRHQAETDPRKRNIYFNIILRLIKNGAVDCEKDHRTKILELVMKSLAVSRDAKLRNALYIYTCYHNLLNSSLVPQLVDVSTTNLDLTVPKQFEHFHYQLNKDVIVSIHSHAKNLIELNITGSDGLTPVLMSEILSFEKLGTLLIDFDQALLAKLTLASHLEQNGKFIHITKLKLNKISLNVPQLCAFLKTTQYCTELDLCNCGLTEATANEIALALKENTSLKVVKLNNNSTLGDKGTANIITALKKNPYLEELYIDGTSAGMQSAEVLSSILLESNALHILTANRALFGDAGVLVIANALQERFNQKISKNSGTVPLHTLMLNEVNMQAPGAKALARALMFHSYIKYLDINYNKGIGNEGAAEILIMLQNNSNITVCRTENIGATGELAQKLPQQIISNIRHHQALLLENVSRRHKTHHRLTGSQTSLSRPSLRNTNSMWLPANSSPLRATARSSGENVSGASSPAASSSPATPSSIAIK